MASPFSCACPKIYIAAAEVRGCDVGHRTALGGRFAPHRSLVPRQRLQGFRGLIHRGAPIAASLKLDSGYAEIEL